jgi:hypothetical protein
MFRPKLNKKSFTLIEIILVVAIISLAYYFTIDNFKFKTINKSSFINISNLKSYMLKFNQELSIVCVDDGKRCFIKDSNNNIIQKVDNLFKSKPIVYEYNKDLKEINFEDLELEQLDRYEVCFKYKINKYKKSDDIIVEVNNKVYIFNSIYKTPIKLDSISYVYDYFEDLKQELKDAI